MTIDPVHYDGIASLAERIRPEADPEEHRDIAETVWESALDPLYSDGEAVLSPIDEQRRFAAPVDALALQEAPFETAHGLDSGTINPTTFKNGLLLDLAQAAMSRTPSALPLHRERTYIMTVHSNDATVSHGTEEWTEFDEGFGRGRIVQTASLARDQERIVHGLALYLAESHHALDHADTVEDVLVLDGPLYPKGIVHWLGRNTTIADLASEDDLVAEVVENYVRLVEHFLERDRPLVGFVKSPQAGALVRTLQETGQPTPWASDAAFFSQVLEQREDRRTDGRVRTELAWTNWFRSRLGADGVFSGDDADLGVDRDRSPESYDVVFTMIYDPRTDLVYKVELPGAFGREQSVREAVEQFVLREIAGERGPPRPVAKADELAKIDAEQKAELERRLERAFDTEVDRNYDRERWGEPYA
ncbi:MAG: DNA double-strand break repair nuclease NurA [Halodesulfurarchaeum sp.]